MKFLPWSFWQSYLYMRRKWQNQLPLKTPCINITKWAFPIVQHPLQSFYAQYIKREQPGRRVADPAALYQELLHCHALSVTAAGSSLSLPGGEGRGEEANNLCMDASRSAPD